MRLLKFSDISTDKIYVVELCSIHFLVLVCEGLHEINSSDMTSVLSYISCKAPVKKSTRESIERMIIKLRNSFPAAVHLLSNSTPTIRQVCHGCSYNNKFWHRLWKIYYWTNEMQQGISLFHIIKKPKKKC